MLQEANAFFLNSEGVCCVNDLKYRLNEDLELKPHS